MEAKNGEVHVKFTNSKDVYRYPQKSFISKIIKWVAGILRLKKKSPFVKL